MNKIVDARGKACPLPVIEAKKAIEEMRKEGLVTVWVDNEIAVQNILKLARHKNLAAASEQVEEGYFAVAIDCPAVAGQPARAGMPGAGGESGALPGSSQGKDTAGEPDWTACGCGPVKERGAVVVLSANVMGAGEEKLGKTLMKAFVFALTRQEELPAAVLLYNSGAFLSCEGSESLEDLKALEAQGVEILTCGTCLDFYGLKEKLGVGGVTNMYEIVEKMMGASFVVRP